MDGFPTTPPILAALALSWIEGAKIPVRFTSKAGRKKEIPLDEALSVASSIDRPGFFTFVSVHGSHHAVYATLFGYRVWVDVSWNASPPTFEGDIVRYAIVTAVNQERDRRVSLMP